MTRARRPSPQTIAVLLALAEQPTTWRYGYELCQQLGLKAGSMYPILMRLADKGMLETGWEEQPPTGRPPRHLYRLTGAGLELAKQQTPQPAPKTKPAGHLRPHLERA
ncbi:MAG TPA: PadR family transcriptional regulator [Candidatus Limnocylindrales bacterium]